MLASMEVSSMPSSTNWNCQLKVCMICTTALHTKDDGCGLDYVCLSPVPSMEIASPVPRLGALSSGKLDR